VDSCFILLGIQYDLYVKIICIIFVIEYVQLKDFKMKNDILTPHFLLLSFDTLTWHVLSHITMKEKTQLFWNTCVSWVECLSG